MVHHIAIEHSRYTLQEREKMSQACLSLPSEGSNGEAVPHVLLATCNRTEVYWGQGGIDTDTARHLMRVAAGLESALIGERAIQGQLKNAYETARLSNHLTPELNKLFQTAMHVGKRVRNETAIAEGAVSHSQVVAQMLIHSQGERLRRQMVGIIGVNKLTEDVLKFLSTKGAVNFVLSNRNIEKAQQMATEYGGMAMSLHNLPQLLRHSDIIISATSAPHTIVKAAMIDARRHPHTLFDLAFPRDIDPEVGSVEGVTLYNLEDIESFAKKNLVRRHEEEGKALKIIEEEIDNLTHWQKNRQEA